MIQKLRLENVVDKCPKNLKILREKPAKLNDIQNLW